MKTAYIWQSEFHADIQQNNMSRVTIKDIARVLGVNPSTISRALHDHPDVSTELKATIKQLAGQMGYKPNQMAINLRNGKSKTIALIIPEISMFFFPSVMKAIEEEAHSKGYNLLVLHSNDDIQREIQNAEICAFTGVEGVLISLTRESFETAHLLDLTYSGIPVVYFDKVPNHIEGHKVVVPGKEATFEAVQYLIRENVRKGRICGFFGDPRLSITQDRVEGFRLALSESELLFDIRDAFFVNNSQKAEEAFLALWESDSRPTALYMMSDEVLAGVIKAVHTLKLTIPQDLQLVAISDGHLPLLLGQNIPFVETSGYTLGKVAVAHLFEVIHGRKTEYETITIETPFRDLDFAQISADFSLLPRISTN